MGKPLIVDGLLLWLIVVGFMLVADYKRRHSEQLTWLRSDLSFHQGAEYKEIAQAIRSSRGFADPFHQPTGHTAWMPPVLPYSQAALYAISGDNRDVVVSCLQGLSGLAILITGLIVIAQARQLRLAWLGYAIFIIGVSANFYELLQKTHDSGLLLLVVSGLYLGSVWVWQASHGSNQRWTRSVGWGAYGGFCALCSPVVGAAWVFITASRWWPGGPQFPIRLRRFQALLMAGMVFLVVITPWTLRNRLVMGKWIPIKSNGMYELWQSHCIDDDGVLDSRTLGLHPYAHGGQQRQRYAEVGEIAFIHEKAVEVRASIAADPVDLIQRVANRWMAACVYYQTYSEEQARLGNGWPVFLKRCIFSLPLLGLLVILWRAPIPLSAPIAAAIAIYALVLLPYVLVSYYDRYAAPLVGMKMLIVLHALALLCGRSTVSSK